MSSTAKGASCKRARWLKGPAKIRVLRQTHEAQKCLCLGKITNLIRINAKVLKYFSFTIWDLYIQFNSNWCMCARVIESLHFVAIVHIYISKTFSLCKGMQCQLEMCVLRQAPPFQNPFGISLSLSLSLFFNFIVLCPIYYYNRSGFSLIRGVQTFLWSITQSICIYNYKLCSGYLLFCQWNGSDYPNELIISVLLLVCLQ